MVVVPLGSYNWVGDSCYGKARQSSSSLENPWSPQLYSQCASATTPAAGERLVHLLNQKENKSFAVLSKFSQRFNRIDYSKYIVFQDV